MGQRKKVDNKYKTIRIEWVNISDPCSHAYLLCTQHLYDELILDEFVLLFCVCDEFGRSPSEMYQIPDTRVFAVRWLIFENKHWMFLFLAVSLTFSSVCPLVIVIVIVPVWSLRFFNGDLLRIIRLVEKYNTR